MKKVKKAKNTKKTKKVKKAEHSISYQNKRIVYDSNGVRLSSILGGGATEAWADIDHYEKESCVSIPSEEAVEIAKAWVDENHK
ncbi:DUF3787 domain-containing protein [Fusibacter sp. 3D3]|uniref:CDIF630_02480 family spore surface protein n=1 Tax=Fusibacter sp. 3D3 TaxID=1048380 RepID=UPI00267E5946|nr:DUF3787 domain-containing protein [Fusibacter sp. 3D3]